MTTTTGLRILAVSVAIAAGIYFSWTRATDGDLPGWPVLVMLLGGVVVLATVRTKSREPTDEG